MAARFFPLIAAYALLGLAAERQGRPWFSPPAYSAAAVLFVIVLELFAFDGRALQHLGISPRPGNPPT